MKLLGQTVLALAIFGSIKAQNQDNCHTYAAGACRDTSDHWSAQGTVLRFEVKVAVFQIFKNSNNWFQYVVFPYIQRTYFVK